MLRGTTPTLQFTILDSVDLTQFADGWVSLSQGAKIIIDKRLSDCECVYNTLSIKLTQEETLRLSSGTYTRIQLRLRDSQGNALASNIITVETGEILKDGVI